MVGGKIHKNSYIRIFVSLKAKSYFDQLYFSKFLRIPIIKETLYKAEKPGEIFFRSED